MEMLAACAPDGLVHWPTPSTDGMATCQVRVRTVVCAHQVIGKQFESLTVIGDSITRSVYQGCAQIGTGCMHVLRRTGRERAGLSQH
jgi:hypothetical protein